MGNACVYAALLRRHTHNLHGVVVAICSRNPLVVVVWQRRHDQWSLRLELSGLVVMALTLDSGWTWQL